MEKLQRFRQLLHRHPELSGQEEETAKRIFEFLQEYTPDELITGIGGHGVVAVYKGKEEGPSVLFRAELDALPIEEQNNFEHRSANPGISHKCGHDGHSCILLGLAMALSEQRPHRGRAVLLFQPAEENGVGARAVLSDPKFEPYLPDNAFALHNVPGYPMGAVVSRTGILTPAVQSFAIGFAGKTAHAGEPEMGVNPAMTMAHLMLAFERLEQPDPQRHDFALLTPIHGSFGEKAYGVAAGLGELHYTIRTWSNSSMQALQEQIETLVRGESRKIGLSMRLDWVESFAANDTPQEIEALFRRSAAACGLPYIFKDAPFKWGEDFGLFTSIRVRGGMFGLGAGENAPALHNPDYDFPDQLIEPGVAMFKAIARELLGPDQQS